MSLFGSAQHAPNARPTHAQQTHALGNTQPRVEQMPEEMQRQLQGVKADPAAFIKQQYGLSVNGATNDPMEIMRNLAQSGQLNAQQMAMFQRVQNMQRVMPFRR